MGRNGTRSSQGTRRPLRASDPRPGRLRRLARRPGRNLSPAPRPRRCRSHVHRRRGTWPIHRHRHGGKHPARRRRGHCPNGTDGKVHPPPSKLLPEILRHANPAPRPRSHLPALPFPPANRSLAPSLPVLPQCQPPLPLTRPI